MELDSGMEMGVHCGRIPSIRGDEAKNGVLPEKAKAVLRFRPPTKLRARIEELAGKSTEGQLTPEEKAEYIGYVRANKFVATFRR